MKKIHFSLFIILLIISCDNSENDDENLLETQEMIEVNESTITKYIYQGQVIPAEVISELDKSTIASSNFVSGRLSELVNSDSLIVYYDGTENARLFNGSKKLDDFLSSSVNKKEDTKRLTAVSNTVIGTSVCWEHANYSGEQLYYREDINPGTQLIAITPYPGGGNWNDRISSIRVNNGAMEFHFNYSPDVYSPGFTLVVHDPNNDPTQAVGISNLANVSLYKFISWNDVISQSRWLLTQP